VPHELSKYVDSLPTSSAPSYKQLHLKAIFAKRKCCSLHGSSPAVPWIRRTFRASNSVPRDRLLATGQKLESLKHPNKPTAVISQLEVTNEQQALHETIANAIAIYGRVDVLVNNAAYLPSGVGRS
jgi:hypothetical protein